jgi:hypothetical protein
MVMSYCNTVEQSWAMAIRKVYAWSLNKYALSKVYYRCDSVDLRVKDLSAITSNLKSWLFTDHFEKPENIIICRPIYHGGLGLDNG